MGRVTVGGYQTTPPGSPEAFSQYIVLTPGAGDWAGQDENIALYFEGTWIFRPKEDGLTFYDESSDVIRQYVAAIDTWVPSYRFGDAENATLTGLSGTNPVSGELLEFGDGTTERWRNVTRVSSQAIHHDHPEGGGWNGITVSGALDVFFTGMRDTYSKSITLERPASGEDITWFFTDRDITIQEMQSVIVCTGIPSGVFWTVRHDPDRSAAGTEVITDGTYTTDTTVGDNLISFNDPTIPADSWIWVESTGKTGVVNQLSITAFYTED